MLQRLKSAFAGFKRQADLVMEPTVPISLSLDGEKDDGKEKREKLKANQLDEEMIWANIPPSPYQVQVETMLDKYADPFSEAPVNISCQKG
ncbi:hypothetical protein TB1_024902 [Malus domestica]